MKLLNIFVSILLFVGAAGAVVELSGTDPAVFDQPGMMKDGIGRDMGSVTWGTPTGWDNAADGKPLISGQPGLFVGSSNQYNTEPVDLPSMEEQVTAYLTPITAPGVYIVPDGYMYNETTGNITKIE